MCSVQFAVFRSQCFLCVVCITWQCQASAVGKPVYKCAAVTRTIIVFTKARTKEGLCPSVLYSTALYCTLLYYTVLYCIILYCTVLYCTLLYYTVLYSTVLYCTLLHSSILLFIAVWLQWTSRVSLSICKYYFWILYGTVLYSNSTKLYFTDSIKSAIMLSKSLLKQAISYPRPNKSISHNICLYVVPSWKPRSRWTEDFWSQSVLIFLANNNTFFSSVLMIFCS